MGAARRGLIDAVERLYRAFQHYPVGRTVEGCPCCVDPADARALAQSPLRHIPDRVLGRYAFKAMSTWGTPTEFLHFVPAIWDRMTLTGLGIAEQILHKKLRAAGFDGLPREERAAVSLVVEAWFSYALAGFATPQTVVECAGLLGMPLGPLISVLDAETRAAEPSAASALACLVLELEGHERYRWIWWADEEAQLLAAWVKEHAAARLQAAFFAHPEHPEAAEWSRAVEALPAGASSVRA